MNFEIASQEVRVANLNVRAERHGDEEVTAIDLKLQWQTGNDALLHFHPELRKALYAAGEARQRVVDGMEALPMRQFPDLGPLRWADEQEPMRLVIHHGLGAKSDLVLDECAVDRFVIEPLDGGTVEITFRVRAVCEDEQILGKLALLLHHDIPVSLKFAPTVVELKKERPKDQKTAEQVFVESHGRGPRP